MWIIREIEEFWNSIVEYYPIVVITGTRQVGKTSLLEHVVGAENLISLDLPSVAARAENSPEAFLETLPSPSIIDEVQYAPSLFRSLKHYVDVVKRKQKRAIVFLTGSERFSLMAQVSESLAGRAAIIELPTLGLRELERYYGKEASKRELLTLLLKGGYPALHATQMSRERFFSNLVSTYIERDVKRLVHIQDTRDFDKFLRLCAVRTGQLLSMNGIAADIGISQPTVKRWLHILEASGIIDIVEPWHSNSSKRMVKTPKLYFNDTGLCSYLSGVMSEDELERSSLLGAFFETLCYGQLRRSFQNRGLQQRIYFYRSRDGVELDFIIPRGSECLAFECKYSENPKAPVKIRNKVQEDIGMKLSSLSIVNAGRHTYPLDDSKTIFAVSCVDVGSK
jgi:uncharacterized protein